MSSSASVVSAVAAALAALLAALNLYYSGRRERQRWVRETLVDLLIRYLDASFAASRAAQRSHGETGIELREEARRAIDDAHDTQDAALTKLRLITGRAMVDAAFNLHGAVHAFVDVATAIPQRTDDDLRRAREELWQARHRFVAAGKRAVGLPRQHSRAT